MQDIPSVSAPFLRQGYLSSAVLLRAHVLKIKQKNLYICNYLNLSILSLNSGDGDFYNSSILQRLLW